MVQVSFFESACSITSQLFPAGRRPHDSRQQAPCRKIGSAPALSSVRLVEHALAGTKLTY
jgi:hypothetical protein